jgi:hypothetical protein
MAQYGRPDTTISGAGWTANGGPSELWDCVNEAPYSDTDYCRGTGNVTMELKFSTVTDPISSSGHSLRFRARSSGSGGPERMNVYIYQGGTLIATAYANQAVNRGSFADYSYDLLTTEADAITDYADIRFLITTSQGSSETIDISWIEFEVPDAPGAALEIQDAMHGHNADNVELTQHNVIAIQNAAHSHSADVIDLIQHNILAIADASHAHAAENVVLIAHEPIIELIIQNASHGHSADNITLTYHTAHYSLIIQDASHSHIADAPDLIQHNILAVDDAIHAHGADNIILTYHPPGAVQLVIADASHGHSADNITLTAYPPAPVYLVIADASHNHIADNVTITAHEPGEATVLTIADAVHAHYADSVVLVAHIPVDSRRYKRARSLAPVGIGAIVRSRPTRIIPHVVEIKVKK